MNELPDPRLVTRRELAKLLSLSCRRIDTLQSQKKFPALNSALAALGLTCATYWSRCNASPLRRRNEIAAKTKRARTGNRGRSKTSTAGNVSRSSDSRNHVRLAVLVIRTMARTTPRSNRQRKEEAMSREEIIAANPMSISFVVAGTN